MLGHEKQMISCFIMSITENTCWANNNISLAQINNSKCLFWTTSHIKILTFKGFMFCQIAFLQVTKIPKLLIKLY